MWHTSKKLILKLLAKYSEILFYILDVPKSDQYTISSLFPLPPWILRLQCLL